MSDLPAGSGTGRILLADDSFLIRAMVREVLESAGHIVMEAANGQQALELCLATKPDVALLDVEMPVMDGRQLLLRLKAAPELADMPVIFLTSVTSTAEIVHGLQNGAHDYLRKPFEAPELIARVSAALRVARLQQELTRQNAELSVLSRTDRLTELSNRRHGEERLQAEMETARRHQQPLAVLMLDVDHFKQVNDQHGHGAGDAVLQELARRMQGILRLGDIAARWGGEEFLVVLPNTALTGAIALAERYLQIVRDVPVTIHNAQPCAVTVSIGVTDAAGLDFDAVLRQADEALYRAKREGRDCLRVAS